MKQLMINADDFGFSEGHNYGIIKAFTEGVVTSTTIMANMPGFEHAVMLAKQHPKLAIGVHLNLTCYRPLTSNHTLMNEKGYFRGEDFLEYYDQREMLAELKAQVNRVLDAGLTIDHFDSHHHIHTNAVMKGVLKQLLADYPYPMRGGFTYEMPVIHTELIDQFYNQKVTKEQLFDIFHQLEDGKVYDLMCHPAYLDPQILELSSYTIPRVKEVEILCDPEVRVQLAKEKIQLINYSAI